MTDNESLVGGIAPTNLPEDIWSQASTAVGRALTASERQSVGRAYKKAVAGSAVDEAIVVMVITPVRSAETGISLCLEVRSLAVDGYADGMPATDVKYDVSIVACLMLQDKEVLA